mmetsp:Transcript_18273/g.27383  ORF Transcript_18273/g.27383 Transcript_18273/m.27383 type:complete len:139 (+) Transcript_18273:172-588(+)
MPLRRTRSCKNVHDLAGKTGSIGMSSAATSPSSQCRMASEPPPRTKLRKRKSSPRLDLAAMDDSPHFIPILSSPKRQRLLGSYQPLSRISQCTICTRCMVDADGIYMYMDRAFCSEKCRAEAITVDTTMHSLVALGFT